MLASQKTAEQIAATEKLIAEKENLLKELRQKLKEQESKERTHREIERGRLLEKMIDGADAFTDEQLQAYLEKTIRSNYAVKALAELKEQIAAEAAAQQAENGETAGEKPEAEQTTGETV